MADFRRLSPLLATEQSVSNMCLTQYLGEELCVRLPFAVGDSVTLNRLSHKRGSPRTTGVSVLSTPRGLCLATMNWELLRGTTLQ